MAPIGRREALIWTVGSVAAVGGLPSIAMGARQNATPLTTSNARDWILRVGVNVRKYQPRSNGRMPRTDGFEFKQAAVVYPLVDRSAASQLDVRRVAGKVELDDRLVTDKHTVIEGYHSGQKLARFDLTDVKADEMELELELPTRCFRTRLDEAAAANVQWPNDWPEAAESTFAPQMYVNYDPRGEYDMKRIQGLVRKWTGGKPKSQPPFVTAKWLTGQVINHFQPSGDGLNFDRSGMIEGLDFERGGAAFAAQRKRGTPWDMVALYVAVMREAGIPARLVVGYDAGGKQDEDDFLGGGNRDPVLRAWAEWFLPSGGREGGVWVPADVVEARKTASRLPNNFMDRPLPF
ncbi:MAG: transglutaminase domain-containing protein, partial [Planctomycetota bacterium]